MSTSRFLFLFLDGIGIGERDPDRNPFIAEPNQFFQDLEPDGPAKLPHEGICIPVDAILGVPGIPQSATGQTSLFTGVNAQERMGMHITGFPTTSLRELIHEHNLLKAAHERGFAATFANAYQDIFFSPEYATSKRRDSVTTTMVRAASIPFHRVSEIMEGRAIYQDFTNQMLLYQDCDVELFTPERAGRQLASIAMNHDVTVYEYFLSDMTGHTQDMEAGRLVVRRLDEFLAGVLANIDLNACTVLVCSDHGNLEDLSQKPHTLNPVPGMFWGPLAPKAANSITRITDITPFILENLPDEQDV